MTSTTPIADIKACIQQDLMAVDTLIQQELHSNVPMMQTIIEYLIRCGGKRIRPTLLLLSAKAYGATDQDNEHHELACIIEFIHNATLLHDDVVDDSAQRRGNDTANQRWGNAASVLAGDFLYSRAFQMLARRNNIPVMNVLANTCNQLSEGELLQLACASQQTTDIANYMDIIAAKTAALFSAACQIGAMLAQPNNAAAQTNMQQFGYHLGMAFQIADDILDLTGDPAITGKNLGDDLAEHKLTLPVLYALTQLNDSEAKTLKEKIAHHPETCLADVLSACDKTEAIAHAKAVGEEHLQQAKQSLAQAPDSNYRQALLDLTDLMVERDA